MRDGIGSISSCSVAVMLDLFLMMMMHILDIVAGHWNFLGNDSGGQSLPNVSTRKGHCQVPSLEFQV